MLLVLDEADSVAETEVQKCVPGLRVGPPGSNEENDALFVGNDWELIKLEKGDELIALRRSIFDRALKETGSDGDVLVPFNRIAREERFFEQVLEAMGYTIKGTKELFEWYEGGTMLKDGLTIEEALVFGPR